jgi:hypothetical protein
MHSMPLDAVDLELFHAIHLASVELIDDQWGGPNSTRLNLAIEL